MPCTVQNILELSSFLYIRDPQASASEEGQEVINMSSGEEFGGYSTHMFVNEDSIHKYICTICTQVARDPQQVSCCNTIYCKTCLLQLQERGSHFNCPNCRHSLESTYPCFSTYFWDGRTNREIMSLEIYCNNRDAGNKCQWVGSMNDIETHLKTCIYQQVTCTNDNCEVTMERGWLEEHLTDNCTQRLVKCQYCQEEGTHQTITGSHIDECPDYPVKCQDCCKKVIRRSLSSHRENCPKVIVTCVPGCDKRMKREEQDKHIEESVKEHTTLAIKRISSLSTELNELRQQIKPTPPPQVAIIRIKNYQHGKNHKLRFLKSLKVSYLGKNYKADLLVYPYGTDEGKGTHVSCYIFIASKVTTKAEFELLNQLENKNHKKETFKLQRMNSRRVSGNDKFISHSELGYNSSLNCQYLKDDCLCFRISVKKTL